MNDEELRGIPLCDFLRVGPPFLHVFDRFHKVSRHGAMPCAFYLQT